MSARIEARREPRFSVQLHASVSDGVVETSATTLDVSASGIAIRGSWLWPVGSRVTVRIARPRGSAVARAVVHRVLEDVMGLRVLVPGPEFARLLRESIE